MKVISLTQGQVTIVDDADYEDLIRFKWHARWNPNTASYYAGRKSWVEGKRVVEAMHRRITGLGQGRKWQVDHINHDTLDNRRINLRIVDSLGNNSNRRDQSKYGVGIRYQPTCPKNPFHALSCMGGKYVHIGSFPTVEEAKTARIKWLERHISK